MVKNLLNSLVNTIFISIENRENQKTKIDFGNSPAITIKSHFL